MSVLKSDALVHLRGVFHEVRSLIWGCSKMATRNACKIFRFAVILEQALCFSSLRIPCHWVVLSSLFFYVDLHVDFGWIFALIKWCIYIDKECLILLYQMKFYSQIMSQERHWILTSRMRLFVPDNTIILSPMERRTYTSLVAITNVCLESIPTTS